MPPELNSPKKKAKKKSKIKKYFHKLAEIITKERLKYLYQFSFVVIVYGALLNYVMAMIFSYPFNYKQVIAIGVGFYFIKEELPRIIGKCFPPKM